MDRPAVGTGSNVSAAENSSVTVTRIAIVGAESTGKTTLAHALANAVPNAVVVPEVLRQWVDAHQRTPHQHEQRAIFDAQIAAEENASCAVGTNGRDGVVICDTTPLTIAIASVHYFNDRSLLTDAIAHHRRYAVTLLCMPDIAWVADGIQRDGPMVRAMIAEMLQLEMLHAGIAFSQIDGEGVTRTARAVAAVRSRCDVAYSIGRVSERSART